MGLDRFEAAVAGVVCVERDGWACLVSVDFSRCMAAGFGCSKGYCTGLCCTGAYCVVSYCTGVCQSRVLVGFDVVVGGSGSEIVENFLLFGHWV